MCVCVCVLVVCTVFQKKFRNSDIWYVKQYLRKKLVMYSYGHDMFTLLHGKTQVLLTYEIRNT